MQWQLSSSVIAEAVTALGFLGAAVYFPWYDLNRRARLIGSSLIIIASLWMLTHSLEIGTPVASYKAYLMGLQLIWGLLAMSLWLIYILYYFAPVRWQTSRIYVLFGVMPLLAIVGVATNHIYSLMWTNPGLDTHNPYLPLDPAYGPFYWGCMVYIGVLVACGGLIIFNNVIRHHNFRRWEPWTLILAAAMPLLAAFLEVTGIAHSTGLTVGITPFFSSIGSILLVWSLPRFRLQKIIPVARNTVFEHIGDCVIVLNMQNRIVDLNPAAEHLAGYTSSEALGLPVEQIWPNWPIHLDPAEPYSTVNEELVLVRAGVPRTYDLHTYPITDDKNRTMNKVALLIDITLRKQSEEQNLHAAQEWRTTFDSITDLVSIHDKDHRIIRVNKAFADAFKKKPADLIGKFCYEVVHGTGGTTDYCPLLVTQKTGKTCTVEEFEPTLGIWMQISTSPIFDEKGKVTATVHAVKNITEHKQMEEERQRSEKLDSIGTLAGGIAHDFNNLLTGILGNIQLADGYLKQNKVDTAQEMLDEAEKASFRARDLTQQLLTFSKGGLPVKKVMSVNQLIRDSATFALRGSKAKPEFALPDNLWAIEADAGQINQVINNLVINADQAMPNGGTINVSARNVVNGANLPLLLTEGNYVEITIKDQGTGIPPALQDKIFDPYFTTKQKGSGLGLATSFSIIKHHGGTITFESEMEVGTTFHLYLPATKEVGKKEKTEVVVTKTQPVATGKVLVMDDEATILLLLARLLQGAGYEVVPTKNGAEAIQKYSEAKESGKPIDAVILDLTIPGGMGGKETMAKLLEIDPKVKAIVSSGYATDPIMAEFKKYGFSGVVTKPYDIKQMQETLRKVLAGK